MPAFSILIPSYNRPEYLPQAIASVLASDFHDFELIVSDDTSPRRAEIERAIEPFRQDRRFTFFAQPTNLGEARNRHYLMERATAPYRIIIGDDDLLAPHALRALHDAIQRHPGYDFYLFGYSIVDEEGRVFETRRALETIELTLNRPRLVEDLFKCDLHPYWFYHPATFCFPTSLHQEIVPNHRIGIGDDLIFLMDAVLAGKRGLILPDVLFSYRKFMGSQTYGQSNLSRGRLANVITRRHIFYALLDRDNIPSPLREFLRGYAFRRAFVYEAAVTDRDLTFGELSVLELRPEHQRELQIYWRRRRNRWYPKFLQITRVLKYSRYFGMAGLQESLRVAAQRRHYRRTIAVAHAPTAGRQP